MRRFIFGNEQQYVWLRDQIQGTLKTFNDISLPDTCTPNTCRIGFEFTPSNGYKLYIDKNIAYTGRNRSFRTLLNRGEASFENYKAMEDFLRSLNCLYDEVPLARNNTTTDNNTNRETPLPEEQCENIEAAITAAKQPIDIDGEQLRERIISKIIGQDKAIKDLADATQIHLSQIKPKRPATIFLAGPTGVGKTESVNALIESLNQLTHDKFKLIRIDCNQLMESHRISQLLGSPPGYVGFGEPALLDPLATNPRCIILWDEIEKAHSNVLKVLMSAMDNGIVQLPTSINGYSELDCCYSIFIFTSNLNLRPASNKIGFIGEEEKTILVSEEDQYKDILVKNNINPEIAGRIAWFMHYEQLTQENIAKVIWIEIEQCAISYGITVKEISDSIINELIQSTGSKFGMRAYKQLISRKLGKVFAACKCKSEDVIISGSLDKIKISLINQSLEFNNGICQSEDKEE